ncbi:unnamed protein product [Closterium sp. Yama58-4]|nr:unnamed protein product [Closterium sp. Yama58-4]
MDRTGKPARLRRHLNGFETLSGNTSVLSDSSVRSPNDKLLTDSVTVTAAYDANRAASSNGGLEVEEDCEGLLTGQDEVVHYDLGGCYPSLSRQQKRRPLEIHKQTTRMPPSLTAASDPSDSVVSPCHVSSPRAQAGDLEVDYDPSGLATSPFHRLAGVRAAQAGVSAALSCFSGNYNGASCASAEEPDREIFESNKKFGDLSCFSGDGNGASCASDAESAEESDRVNGEEEPRVEGREGASESMRDDRSDLDSSDWAEEAERAEGAEETGWAEGAEWTEGAGRAERAEGNASGVGGYEFRGWEYEAEMAMLAESVAEEGVAEQGIAEEAKGQHVRESWLSSVEWFVSWPLRRLSDPWRRRVLWVWVLAAAAILSLVFTVAWQHAQATERDDLEGHCEEWGAFIEAKFNITAANTRSISDFIRAYYLDNVKEDLLDVSKFQRFTQATLDSRPMASFVGFVLLINNTFVRDMVEGISNHCIFAPEPNGTLSCRPRDLPLYAPVVIFNARKEFNARVNLSAVCCNDLMANPPFNHTFHRAIDSASSAMSSPFMRDNYPYHFIGDVFPVYSNCTTFALPPSPSPPSVAIPPLATPGVLPRGFVIAGYNFANLRSLVGFQQLVELNARVYVVDGTRGGAWDGARNEDGKAGKWLPALLFDHEGVVGEEEIGAWMMDGEGQEEGGRVRRRLHMGDPTRKFYLFCEHIAYTKQFGPFIWIIMAVLFLSVSTILLWTSIQLMHAFESDCQQLVAAQHELRAARLVAEAASRAKGAFLTTMSHEIRTPMNGVIGMLNLLMETPLDRSQQDYAEMACSSGRALCALINDILDLSKIEAEKLRLERIPLDLRAELDDVLALFVESAQEKRCVELAAFVADDVPEMLVGDPLRVKQILINLISNAFKFTTKGHIFIAVRLATTTDTNCSLKTSQNTTNSDTNSSPAPPPLVSPSSSTSSASAPASAASAALKRRKGAAGDEIDDGAGGNACMGGSVATAAGGVGASGGSKTILEAPTEPACLTLSGIPAMKTWCSWEGMQEHMDLAAVGMGKASYTGHGNGCGNSDGCGDLHGDGCGDGHGDGEVDGNGNERGRGVVGPNQPVRLLVAVEDTGTGIPRHARRHIFRPYAQAERSTARLHGGTGIGLSICKVCSPSARCALHLQGAMYWVPAVQGALHLDTCLGLLSARCDASGVRH